VFSIINLAGIRNILKISGAELCQTQFVLVLSSLFVGPLMGPKSYQHVQKKTSAAFKPGMIG